jgi:lipoprotein-releasing system permease protein
MSLGNSQECDDSVNSVLIAQQGVRRWTGVALAITARSMILTAHERLIAKRYLLPGKGEGFIFLVAAFSLVAVALGVAVLIVVLSITNGFRAELFDKIVGLNGHAVVQGYGGRLTDWRQIMDDVRKTPGVTSATPLIEQPLMASFTGRVEGVIVRGMQAADIQANPSLKGKVLVGALKDLTPESGNVAIGSRLANSLGAQVGSTISLISPDGQTTPFGSVPRIVSYRVAAIFEIGIYDYDKAFVIMPMEDAQTLLLMGDAVGMVEVQTNDPDNVSRIMAPLVDKVSGKAQISDWRSMNASLFEALAVDRVVSFFVVSLITLVAVFNIMSSLIMLVRSKTRDIAIVRTMGASRASIVRIFMTVGVTIGLLGIAAGAVLGFIFLYFRQGVINGIQMLTGAEIWDPSIRFLTELPAKTNPVEVAMVLLLGTGLTFLATLYPAFKAASTDPVQVLRYE